MLGTNKTVHRIEGDGMSLEIVDIYDTVVGEGPFAGVPAVFIKLSHCNLKCFFCDSDFGAGTKWEMMALMEYLIRYLSKVGERMIVITGGEPLLHPLGPLLHRMGLEGMSYQIETAGSINNRDVLAKIKQASPLNLHLYSGSLVVSPKGPKIIEEISLKASGYIYVVRAGELDEKDGLPNFSTQTRGRFQPLARPPKGYPPRAVYLQPCSEGSAEDKAANLLEAWTSCKRHGYRIGLRQQKLLGLK